MPDAKPESIEEIRESPPYFMHDMILDQPEAIRATSTVCQRALEGYYAMAGGKTQFINTGCGSSYHAALVGSYTARSLFPGRWIEAIESFELLNYFNGISKDTFVSAFSHTGNTKTTLDAARKARSENQAAIVGLTGVGNSSIADVADLLLAVGNGRDRSRAHTKAYTSAAFASIYLSVYLAAYSQKSLLAKTLLDKLTRVPDQLRNALSTAKQMEELVNSYVSKTRNYCILGAGPNVVTALEGALKFKETSYFVAEGMALEQFLHGSWVALNRDSLVFVLAPSGPSKKRNLDFLRACEKVNVPTVAITDDTGVANSATCSIMMAEIDEILSPLTYVVPLQFFSYFAAVGKGLNPDMAHYQDPLYRGGGQLIFPPGTH